MSDKTNNPLEKLSKHIQDAVPADIIQKIEENQSLMDSIDDLKNIYALLLLDVIESAKVGDSTKSDQFTRRSTYRTVFSWIEGVVYNMKLVALCTQGGYYQAKFSPAELDTLQEKSYKLEDKGKLRTIDNKYEKFFPNLRFVFSMVAKGFNLSTKLEVDKHGWEPLKKAKKTRDLIVHPKNLKSLKVTDENMKALQDTIDWFDKQFSQLFIDIKKTALPIKEQLRAESEMYRQDILNNAMETMGRAGKVEDVIAIIDELASKNIDLTGKKKKFELAREKLDELRKEIMNDLTSPNE